MPGCNAVEAFVAQARGSDRHQTSSTLDPAALPVNQPNWVARGYSIWSDASRRHCVCYENQLLVSAGDYVMAHGRFYGCGRRSVWIAADIVRIERGRIAEHWDVLQDDAKATEFVNGLTDFVDRFRI